MNRFVALVPLLLAVLAASTLRAATVNWTTSTVAGPTDVSTAGTLVGAMNVGSATPQTVNGVTFAADPTGAGTLTLGSGTVAFGNLASTFNNFWTAADPGGDAAYAAALDTGRWGTSGSGTVTLGGLTVGRTYLVQLWIADTRAGFDTRIRTVDGVATTSGGPNIATGAFIADATTQVISVDDGANTFGPQVNLLQVRDATFTVITTADSGAGSLRQALADAATFSGADTITLAAALSGQTITLGSEIVVNGAGGVTVDATALAGGLTVNGGAGGNRLFSTSSGPVTLAGLNLTGGDGGGATSPGFGGAILNQGTLTLTRCTLSGNSTAEGSGGAIANTGTLTLRQCTVSGNSAGTFGGGLYNNGSAHLLHCTVANNHAGDRGGGIYNNTDDVLTLENSLVAGNSALFLADIFNGGTLTRVGANLVQTTVVGTLTVADPLLAALAANNGPTPTHATLAGSPARDAAVGSAITADQRGYPLFGTADIGAYEGQLGTIAAVTVNEDTATDALPFTVGTVGTLAATSGNTALVPNANLVLGGSGGSRTLTATPLANAHGTATLTVTDTASGETTACVLTVTPLADTPSVTGATTLEDTQTTTGLVLSRNAADGAEVTHFKITAITSGTLFLNNGTTPITAGSFITFAQGNAGLKFTPTANFSGNASFTFRASTSGVDAGLGGGTVTASITVTPGADTPSVTGATTREDTQTTTGLVLSRNVADGAEVTHFKITAITGGTLFLNNGTTAITAGSFITFAEGNAGLKFTPAANFNGNASFTFRASTSGADAGLGGGTVTASITVTAVNNAPGFTKGADQSTQMNFGPNSVSGWATSITDGDAEVTQTLTFLVTNDNPALFTTQPAISANGTLTYTPAPFQTGTAIVTVRLQDNGGTAHGGVDTSPAQTFTIAVSDTSTTLIVTNTSGSDEDPGSLPYVILHALDESGSRRITFDPSLDGQTITLSSEIVIFDSESADVLLIDASNLPAGLTLHGGTDNRIFSVDHDVRAALCGLTLAGGNSFGGGGAIMNHGTLTLTHCTLSGNSAVGGGAIMNHGTLALTRCTLSENTTSISNGGSAIFNSGTLTLTHCTLSENTTSSGIGGSAIVNIGTLTLANSLIAGNTPSNGPDIRLDSGTLIRSGVNLIGNNATVTNQFPAPASPGQPNAYGDYVGTSAVPLDPRLAALADNGGPTRTMRLLSTSPALNRIAPPLYPTDQRGFPIVGAADIGAYENGAPTLTAPADQVLLAGGNTGALQLTVGDSETAVASLTLTADSSNPTLVPLANVVLRGNGANRTVTVTPAAGQIGSAAVTLMVSDGANSTSKTFLVQVANTDFCVFTTGGLITVIDLTGAGNTLTLTQPGAGTLQFDSAGRTFSVDIGPSLTGNSGSLSLAGVTQVVVHAGAGNDTLNVGALNSGNHFTAIPNLTLNGGPGDDTVNFHRDVTFIAGANLDVDLQNDAAAPGVDQVTMNSLVTLSGPGTATVKVSRSITVGDSAGLETADGTLLLEANRQALPTAANFVGISINAGGTVHSTGAGTVTVRGTGGAGSGATGYGSNHGVNCSGTISSAGGNVVVTALGGGSSIGSGAGTPSHGLVLAGGRQISAGGAGTLTVQGIGGGGNVAGNRGVVCSGTLSSASGNVMVTGQGRSSGSAGGNVGVNLETGGLITAGGVGMVTVHGDGAPNGIRSLDNRGVSAAGSITSTDGDVVVAGQGGTGCDASHGLSLTGTIRAGGAGRVTLEGTGRGGFAYGITSSATITSGGGDVRVTGIPGTLGQDWAGLHFTGGSLTTAANGGTLTLISDSMSFVGGTLSTRLADSVTLRPRTADRLINLGSTSDTVADTLGISDSELDRITTGTLFIGDATSGTITVSAALSPANYQVLALGQNTTFAAAGRFNADIGPTAADYERLTVAGSIALDPAAQLNLTATGGYVPQAGDAFTLLANDVSDAINGTFSGKPEGAVLTGFAGSGSPAELTYVGGTGNDLVVTVTANAPPTATNLSAAETYTEDTALNLTDLVVTDVDSVSVTATLTLSVPAAGTLSTATSGTVTSTFSAGVWTASGAVADVNTLLAGVTFSPAANFNAGFTLATGVSDGEFTVTGAKGMTGTAVNDVPRFTKGADQSIGPEITAAQSVPGWATGISDGDGGVQALTFTVTETGSSGLFTVPPAVAADGTLTYTPNGTVGTATFSVTLTDDATQGGPALTSASQTFTLSVVLDYAVTTSAGVLTVTELSGADNTLTLTQPSEGNLQFDAPGRTFSVNGGPALTGSSGSVSLAGLTEVVVNAGAGNDTLNVGVLNSGNHFTAFPSLTLNGGTGDDTVNFNRNLTFVAGANLDVDLQNDDPAPGVDQVTVASSRVITLSGSGTATVKVSRSIVVNGFARLETADGALLLEANRQAVPTAAVFRGILVNGTVRSTGAGTVTLRGTGGAGSGDSNLGIECVGTVTSAGGDVVVTGQGGGSGGSFSNLGLYLNGGLISAGGAGTLTVQGTGGLGSGGGHSGIRCAGILTSAGGAVVVTGVPGGRNNSEGIVVSSGSLTTAANGGGLTLVSDWMRFSGGTISTRLTDSVTLRPLTAGRLIDLGSTSDTVASTLGLSDAELDRITTGTLVIGDATSGRITVSAALSPANYQVLALGQNTTFAAGGRFNSDLGPTAADYERLTVAGTVTLNAAAQLNLTATGGYVPQAGDAFTLLANDGNDAINGTFSGKPEGFTAANFLGSGAEGLFSYLGGDGNDLVVAAPNTAPLAGADSLERAPRRALRIPVATLLANDSSPLGLPLSIVAVPAASTGGVPLLLAGGVVFYQAPGSLAATDTFTYTVGDGTRTATGTVTVTVRPESEAPTQNILATALVGDAMQVTAAGIPGRSYRLQRAPSLASPVTWSDLGAPVAADALGQLVLTDPVPVSPGFYRVIETAAP